MGDSLKSNHDAFMELSRNMATMYMNRSGNNFVKYEGSDFINTVAFAMHLRPDHNKLVEGSPGDIVFFPDDVIKTMQHVLDAIKDYGGNDPYMIIYPIVLESEDNSELFDDVVCLPLFRVRKNGDENTSQYVDTNGRRYSGEYDFKTNVQLPPGKMSYPKNLVFSPDKDGNAEIVYTYVNTSHGGEYLDLTISLLCLGAGALAIFTGVGIPLGVGIAVACGGYGVTRSAQVLIDRATHGQSINPFTNWDSFNAWAGIGANVIGVGAAANSIRLSGTISRMAEEGLAISRSTQFALKASIYVPYLINGGLMLAQFYELATFWDRLPVQHKIMIGLQFLFFAAVSAKMKVLSVKGIEERTQNVAYQELRNHVERNANPELASSMDRAAERIGGRNYRTINFLKKLANYKRGTLIKASVDEELFGLVELTKKGDEIGITVEQKYFCGPEAVIQVNTEVDIQESDPSSSIHNEYKLPMTMRPIFAVLEVNRFVDMNKIEEGKNWLRNQLRVNELENYKVNGNSIFENMKYHDQIRLLIFEDIGKGLNENLTNICLRYASEQNVNTVGQYASEYEISSLQIHKLANELAETFRNMTPAQVEQQHGINLTTTTETRMTYNDVASERANILFADEPKPKVLSKMRREGINSMGRDDGGQIMETWRSSIQIPEARTIPSPDADLPTLANEVINAGDLSFSNSEYQAINASKFLKQFGNVDVNRFPQTFVEDANLTIRSCRGSVETRVFEASRPNDARSGIRRLVFWSLEDENYAKSVVVSINKKTREVRIQNFTLKKISTSATVQRNAKDAIFEHWENNFNYDEFKNNLRTTIDAIKSQTEDYVGPQMVRPGLDHAETVSDIQNLRAVRFASVEHAICHVLKHGENITTNEQLATKVKDYFDKAQDIIKSTIGHPENVSSSWTQTGSARDFIFYRKATNGGVEKVVVLVREGGEVIMKTYFLDEKMSDIPPQKTHSYLEPVDIKHADLRTFYFQLMLLAPRYGVLLPKDYELIVSDLDKEKTRTMIIMAGYYFEKDGSVNTEDLYKAINTAFPIDGIEWSVVAMKVGKAYSFDVKNNRPYYMFVRINDYRLLFFAQKLITNEAAVLKPGAKEKYGSFPKRIIVEKAVKFDDPISIDIASRICSNYTRATEITKAMNESFGNEWNCFWLTDYYYDIKYYHEYLRMYLKDSDAHCIVFR